jgi:hypothetical protein
MQYNIIPKKDGINSIKDFLENISFSLKAIYKKMNI